VLKIITEKNRHCIETNGSKLYFFIVFRQMATFSHTLDLYLQMWEASLLLFYICTHTIKMQ